MRKTMRWIATWELLPGRVRTRLLRWTGIAVGQRALVHSDVAFVGSALVDLGESSMVNRGCLLVAHAPIRIGRQVQIAPHVRLLTMTHEVGGPDKRAGRPVARPIRIGAGSWLGAGVIVLPGVSIGEGCIVAAGAVVTDDCAPNGVCAGIPAAHVRDLPG